MDRKKFIVIQICLWVGIVLFLTGVFVMALVGDIGHRLFQETTTFVSGQQSNKRSEVYTQTLDGIEVIDIEAISEEVIVEAVDGTEIVVTQSTNYELQKDERIKIDISKGKLSIKKPNKGIIHVPRWNAQETIHIALPKTYENTLRVKSVSGDIDLYNVKTTDMKVISTSGEVALRDVSATEMEIRTTSGNIDVSEVEVNVLTIGTTSGDVEVEGDIENIKVGTVSGEAMLKGAYGLINVNSTSGDVGIISNSAIEKLDVVTISGDVELEVPKDSQFEVTLHSVSGKLKGDIIDRDVKSGESFVYGNGKNQFTIRTTSGKAEIDTID
ncbi:MAG: DUF4097 family beta strand repeat-containing protein [Cellulosilyticaceae bacterium]